MRLSGRPLAVQFSPDGKRLLTVSFQYGTREAEVRFWDATSGRPLVGPPLQTGMMVSAAFHPGGRMVATNGLNEVRLWNPATGRPIGPGAEGQELGNTVEFSPDGATLLASGLGGLARLLEVPDLPDDLERAGVWIQAITGLEVNARGDISRLDEAAWKSRRERLASLGGPPVPPARWRFDPILPAPTRPRGPGPGPIAGAGPRPRPPMMRPSPPGPTMRRSAPGAVDSWPGGG